MEGVTLVCIPLVRLPSLILHRLNRDLIGQMSWNPAIGRIPLGRHANRTCLEPSRSVRATRSTQECSLQAGIKES